MAGLPADVLEARAGAVVTALGERAAALGALATPSSRSRAPARCPAPSSPRSGSRSTATGPAALRPADPPVVARVRDGRTYLDLRTVDPADDATLTKALAALPPARP